MILKEVFEGLRGLQLVETQFEFSTDWVGKNRTYLSCVAARDLVPSADALLTLMQRLQRKSGEMRKRCQHKEADTLAALAKRVWDAMLVAYPA